MYIKITKEDHKVKKDVTKKNNTDDKKVKKVVDAKSDVKTKKVRKLAKESDDEDDDESKIKVKKIVKRNVKMADKESSFDSDSKGSSEIPKSKLCVKEKNANLHFKVKMSKFKPKMKPVE